MTGREEEREGGKQGVSCIRSLNVSCDGEERSEVRERDDTKSEMQVKNKV